MEECPICLDNLKGRCKTHTTECNHTFHAKCFAKIKGTSCPCCRAVFPKDKKAKIVDMKYEIKTTVEQYNGFKQQTKKLFMDRSKEMNARQKELNTEIKKLQTMVKSVKVGSLINSFDSQIAKITVLTTSLEERKRIVMVCKNRMVECRDYFEPIIEAKKYNLENFVRQN